MCFFKPFYCIEEISNESKYSLEKKSELFPGWLEFAIKGIENQKALFLKNYLLSDKNPSRRQ